jgi:hypothetical protein
MGNLHLVKLNHDRCASTVSLLKRVPAVFTLEQSFDTVNLAPDVEIT